MADGTLHPMGSIYSHENKAIYDGLAREGMPLVTFAPILKHNLFPLTDILNEVLAVAERGMSREVELEFAVSYSVSEGPREFYLLQLRPLVLNQEQQLLDLKGYSKDQMLCRSSKMLGSGHIGDIRDIVFVDRQGFDRSRTHDASVEVGKLNAKLEAEERPYLLIGLGRWGSTDPWLGIPVSWDQISGARVIVESGFEDIRVQPSEGAHFFHNITSLSVGYFTVNEDNEDDLLNWGWLREHDTIETGELVSHLRLDQPLKVLMDGHNQTGIILKPGAKSDLTKHNAEQRVKKKKPEISDWE
jgi:hypothetical protein